MQKKIAQFLLLLFLILAFFSPALADKEKEVMKRYDYSSPKASFESLKKAIDEKDIEGILIHEWQANRLSSASYADRMSFDDFFLYYTKKMLELSPKEKTSWSVSYLEPGEISLEYSEEDPLVKWPRESILKLYGELNPEARAKLIIIKELDFVKEKERRRDAESGVTICQMILERRSDGLEISDLVSAYNYDGINEWWIALFPSGE